MGGHQEYVDWSSPEHAIRLNPRWPTEASTELARVAREVLRAHASEPSLVLASSGTTAGSWREIKLILIAKAAFLSGAKAVAQRFSIGPSDVLLNSLPLFHVGGLAIGARAHVSGAQMIERSPGVGESPTDFWREVVENRVSVLSLVPTQLYDLIERKVVVPGHLRVVFMGGAVLPVELEKRARQRLWPLVSTYGMTETSAMIAVRTEPDPSMGFEPLPHVTFVRSENGRLKVKGDSLAEGFARISSTGGWDWTPLRDRGGWVTTEDRVDERNGRWFPLGREADYVKILGEAVNLGSLRQQLESQAMRIGLDPRGFHLTWAPDERRGARLVLVVEDRMPDLTGLLEGYHRQVLPFERILEQRRIAVLPRTATGKVAEQILLRRHLLE